MRTVVAVAAVLYLLAYTVAQCGIFLAHGHEGEDVHVSSSSALPAEELNPGHAHIDDGSAHLAHEAHTVVAMPRSDNPLRPLTVAAVIAMALAVVLVVMSAPRTPRAPPDLPVPIRHGRTVLNELCINRC
ncbi:MULTISPECIES: hypothetical protein [unclassified Rhodococcus (in: high G+C Gram-positive bacteria)]|uniref:hypothetical protein n=1 Tax=unclassified Rhodococcus (in: high G+C Gram-positive bacteria) TaxID=192944 RepID=UPI00030A3AE9|nr:hypothetical protein [Rhodococcus sp. DK17]